MCGEWKTTFWFPNREGKENTYENMRVIKQNFFILWLSVYVQDVKDIHYKMGSKMGKFKTDIWWGGCSFEVPILEYPISVYISKYNNIAFLFMCEWVFLQLLKWILWMLKQYLVFDKYIPIKLCSA